jgi:hypothetical protein
MSQSVRVRVERCWRHRGAFSLRNFFVLGHVSDSSFICKIVPISYFDSYMPEIEKQFSDDGVVTWAYGELTPERMVFHHHPLLDEIDIKLILRSAFLSRLAEQKLDQFLEADVYLYDRSLNCTIGSLLVGHQAFHQPFRTAYRNQ